MPGNLTLQNYSEFELLYLIEDIADADGWVTSLEVAERLGVTHKHPATQVCGRLSWAVRFGLVEKRTEKGYAEWRLTGKGDTLLHPANLKAAALRALDSLDEAQRVAMIRVASQGLAGTSREAMHLARREWIHNVGGWRDPSIAPRRA